MKANIRYPQFYKFFAKNQTIIRFKRNSQELFLKEWKFYWIGYAIFKKKFEEILGSMFLPSPLLGISYVHFNLFCVHPISLRLYKGESLNILRFMQYHVYIRKTCPVLYENLKKKWTPRGEQVIWLVERNYTFSTININETTNLFWFMNEFHLLV